MSHTIIRANEARVTETPNAVMTTLASPQTCNSESSVWLVQMGVNSSGPLHSMDSEQIWHVIAGEVQCEIDGEVHQLDAGDTLRIAGGTSRQFSARTDVTMIVSGQSSAVATTDSKSQVPPWIS